MTAVTILSEYKTIVFFLIGQLYFVMSVFQQWDNQNTTLDYIIFVILHSNQMF